LQHQFENLLQNCAYPLSRKDFPAPLDKPKIVKSRAQKNFCRSPGASFRGLVLSYPAARVSLVGRWGAGTEGDAQLKPTWMERHEGQTTGNLSRSEGGPDVLSAPLEIKGRFPVAWMRAAKDAPAFGRTTFQHAKKRTIPSDSWTQKGSGTTHGSAPN